MTAADNSVVEATGNTITGDISVSADAGISALTIAGQDITNASTTPVVINGSFGTLTVTGFNASTGEIDYSYVEDGDAEDHSGGDDSIVDQFAISLTDGAGETATDSLDIQIIDTAPTAVADTNSVTEDASPNTVTGNVIAGTDTDGDPSTALQGTDTLGADTPTSVTAIAVGSVGTALAGSFGSVTLNADGSYSYALDNSLQAVQALDDGESLTDAFTYTITDADGDTSTTTLTITINGVTDGAPTIDVEDEDSAVTAADNSVVEATGNTITGDISVSADAGISALTIAGQDITNASTPVVTPVTVL